MMLNWLTRYAPAMAALEEAGDPGSILDVGCGPHGLSCVRPEQPFVGLDIEFTGPPAPTMTAFRAAPGPIPFEDGAFDTVLSLDALEHVPRADRGAFVGELARVAAGRVLLACPSAAAQPLDDLLRLSFARRGIAIPSWLEEHGEHGLPTSEEIAGLVAAVPGFSARRVPMANGVLSTALVLADMTPETAGAAGDDAARHAAEWTDLLAGARFGESFRDAWLLEREVPLPALVSAADLPRSAEAALRPPGAERIGAAPVPAPPAAAVALATDAGRKLWLSPDWCRPETWLGALSAYVAAAPHDGSTCLALDATANPELGPDVVAALAAEACERLAGDAPFAEVLVVPDRVEDDVLPVATAADVREALGAPPPPEPDDDDEILAVALWGKTLADDLRDMADAWRFNGADGGWDEPEPLVTVRIPTWNGVDGLVGRAIPSVLRGSYRNLELLVCSDGPDPAARAAVEAIPDPRVRYLELPERPSHPSHPWSFWETTGLRPSNAALDEARGSFICPLDHDDAFTRDHVAELLAAARTTRADLVYGQALCETVDGPPHLVGEAPLRHGHIAHGSVLYSRRLAHMRYDTACWLLGEPGDFNMWRRMAAIGARVEHLPRVVLAHSRERTSIEDDPRSACMGRRDAADLAPDVLGTDARWLLEIRPLVACAPTS